MSTPPLSDKDTNAYLPPPQQNQAEARDTKLSLASRMARQAEGTQKYVSPSDGIMSPCTAKLSALRNKKMDKAVRPRSLFQRASARSLGAANGGLLSDKSTESGTETAAAAAADTTEQVQVGTDAS